MTQMRDCCFRGTPTLLWVLFAGTPTDSHAEEPRKRPQALAGGREE